MKLKDTITHQERIELIVNHTPCGVFKYMLDDESETLVKRYRKDLCFGYYQVHSGGKTISPIYHDLLSEETTDSRIITEKALGQYIESKFSDKWNRVYTSLVQEQYDVMTDYSEKSTKTGKHTESNEYSDKDVYDSTNNDTTTYNTTEKKSGTDTETTTYNTVDTTSKNIEDTKTFNTSDKDIATNIDTITFDINNNKEVKRGSKQTTSSTTSQANDRYGFNSETAVGDTESEETTNETVTGLADDNVETSTDSKTGTESTESSINDTKTKTGTEKDDISESGTLKKTGTETKQLGINETTTKTGTDKIGRTEESTRDKSGNNSKNVNTEASDTISGLRGHTHEELIEQELDLRSRYYLFDIIYHDLDSVLTLNIY